MWDRKVREASENFRAGVTGECPMTRPNIGKCAICGEYYTTDALCEASILGRYERICLTCLRNVESRSQRAIEGEVSEPEEESEEDKLIHDVNRAESYLGE
jgi:hypothetical protein